uniref:Uncharacterized protein n=1 Tax=Arundo donax TaxID=35708 RepID=A0A0A9CW94_ARUDO
MQGVFLGNDTRSCIVGKWHFPADHFVSVSECIHGSYLKRKWRGKENVSIAY